MRTLGREDGRARRRGALWQRLGRSLAGIACAAAFTGGLPCFAQSYPTKPIRFVVPYPPGGGTDYTAREIGARLTEALGQQVVIDNRPGAGASLGHGLVAKAAADGYTLLLATTGGMVSSPALGVKLSYDPLKDFAPVGIAVYVPYTFVVNAQVPGNTLQAFVEYAKTKPGRLNFGSPGVGTPPHLGGVMLMRLTGIDMVHVPYKGGGPLLTDLLAGHVQTMFQSLPQVLPHVRTGRLKVLAVGHPTRLRAAPDIPAIVETVPEFSNPAWFGVVAPAGTPNAIVARLNAALSKIMTTPEVVRRFEANGLEPATTDPQQYGDMIRRDLQTWRTLIREANISVQTAQ
jgi:tripartite-type tricarboxylate transporter receptor subunit TctC